MSQQQKAQDRRVHYLQTAVGIINPPSHWLFYGAVFPHSAAFLILFLRVINFMLSSQAESTTITRRSVRICSSEMLARGSQTLTCLPSYHCRLAWTKQSGWPATVSISWCLCSTVDARKNMAIGIHVCYVSAVAFFNHINLFSSALSEFCTPSTCPTACGPGNM